MGITELKRHLKCAETGVGFLHGNGRLPCAGLPIDPDEELRSLRYERYVRDRSGSSRLVSALKTSYYAVRPLLPVGVRKHLQRIALRPRGGETFPYWPTDTSFERLCDRILEELFEYLPRGLPFIWFWPEGKSACLLMTHDVESETGLRFLPHMTELESAFGLRSSFELVPEERYTIRDETLSAVRSAGHEVCVHGLNHDGRLFSSYAEFERRAPKINMYLDRFGARGFRSPVLYRNLEWLGELAIEFDMSVPNSGRYDPQPGGCCTVFPYFIGSLVELPLTMVQDYTVFQLLGRSDLGIWLQQIETVLARSGLMTFNIHPDYVSTGRYYNLYLQLLLMLRKPIAEDNVWNPLPSEAARWWRERDAMRITESKDGWQIIGKGSERAVVAVMMPENGRLTVKVQSGNRYAFIR